MTWAMWLTVSELREFTVRASYIVFLFVKTENNNFIKEIKKCLCLHSLLKTSAKLVRILEQVKTRQAVEGFHWSALEFSQPFASVRQGKHVLFFNWTSGSLHWIPRENSQNLGSERLVKIQGFGTAWSARAKLFTFPYIAVPQSVSYKQRYKFAYRQVDVAQISWLTLVHRALANLQRALVVS